MPLPAILNTCQQIRSEASVLYYKYNSFRCIIHEGLTMTPVLWVKSLFEVERSAISKLVVELTTSDKLVQKYKRIRAYARLVRSSQCCNWSSWIRSAGDMAMLRNFDHRKVEYVVQE